MEDFMDGGDPDIDAEGVVSCVDVEDTDEEEINDNQLPDLETPLLLLLVTDGEAKLDEQAAHVDLVITETELFVLNGTLPTAATVRFPLSARRP